MNKYFRSFYETVNGAFQKILESNERAIDKASDLMVGSIERDELIHVFGTGGH